jgi:hypothetical protein
MNKKSPPINYKEEIRNPKYNKELRDAKKFELCVTMRLKDIVPKPNCNENIDELITRLKKNGVYKALDLDGITDAIKFREVLKRKNF